MIFSLNISVCRGSVHAGYHVSWLMRTKKEEFQPQGHFFENGRLAETHSLTASSQVTRLGFIIMNLRRNNSQVFGKVRIHHHPKSPRGQDRSAKKCTSCSWTDGECYLPILFLKDRLWIRKIFQKLSFLKIILLVTTNITTVLLVAFKCVFFFFLFFFLNYLSYIAVALLFSGVTARFEKRYQKEETDLGREFWKYYLSSW